MCLWFFYVVMGIKHRTIRKCKSGPNFTGQHLLHHPKTIKQLIETAGLQSTDTVLEIGAGKGSLTFPIAEKAGKVVALEIDTDFAQALREKSRGYLKIKIIQGDIRDIRLPKEPFCVVANIPFSITTTILEKLLEAEGKAFQKAALILEKGAARRFTESTTLNPRLLMWRMNFRFEMRKASGTEYENTSSIHHTPGFRPGTRVTVRYNPEQPEQAIIDSFAQNGTVFVVVGYVLTGFGVMIAVLALSVSGLWAS